MKVISTLILIVTFGYFIYYKYLRPEDTRELTFLDDTHWETTTVDHYYSGLEYVLLFLGLLFAFFLNLSGV